MGVLNQLSLREQDPTLGSSVDILKMRDDFNWTGEEVNLNCILFFEALVKQQTEFRKLGKGKGKKK